MGISFGGGTSGFQMGKSDAGVLQLMTTSEPIRLVSATLSFPVGADRSVPVRDVRITIGKRDNGTIEITNDDPSQIIYFSNVLDGNDLPASEFTDTSTSALDALISNQLFATHAVPDFSLTPGQERIIGLGPVNDDNYTSFVFTADTSPTPSPNALRMGLASALELPEPKLNWLVGVCLMLLARAAALRRKETLEAWASS
jgi:hypothetical protein